MLESQRDHRTRATLQNHRTNDRHFLVTHHESPASRRPPPTATAADQSHDQRLDQPSTRASTLPIHSLNWLSHATRHPPSINSQQRPPSIAASHPPNPSDQRSALSSVTAQPLKSPPPKAAAAEATPRRNTTAAEAAFLRRSHRRERDHRQAATDHEPRASSSCIPHPISPNTTSHKSHPASPHLTDNSWPNPIHNPVPASVTALQPNPNPGYRPNPFAKENLDHSSLAVRLPFSTQADHPARPPSPPPKTSNHSTPPRPEAAFRLGLAHSAPGNQQTVESEARAAPRAGAGQQPGTWGKTHTSNTSPISQPTTHQLGTN